MAVRAAEPLVVLDSAASSVEIAVRKKCGLQLYAVVVCLRVKVQSAADEVNSLLQCSVATCRALPFVRLPWQKTT